MYFTDGIDILVTDGHTDTQIDYNMLSVAHAHTDITSILKHVTTPLN